MMPFSCAAGNSYYIGRFLKKAELCFVHCSVLKLQYGNVSHTKCSAIISGLTTSKVANGRKLEKMHAGQPQSTAGETLRILLKEQKRLVLTRLLSWFL